MLADDELPGVDQRDLGEFRLMDLDRPERVHRLDVEGLPTEFPPLRTGDAPTAYAGKEDELAEAAAGLRRPFYRRPVVIGALAGVLAAAVAIPVFALGSGSGANVALASVQDNAVGVVDARPFPARCRASVGSRSPFPAGARYSAPAGETGRPDGTVIRYWWRHIQDDAGFLADQALDPTFPGLERISAEGFFDLWGTPE